jgi:hypothetical protein
MKDLTGSVSLHSRYLHRMPTKELPHQPSLHIPSSLLEAIVAVPARQWHNVTIQTQSSFFALPGEIRQIIYLVLIQSWAPKIHIIRKADRLGHVRCRIERDPDGKILGCAECQFPDLTDGSIQRWAKLEDWTLLNFARTCKLACTEFLPLLYSNTMFIFAPETSLIDFTQSTPSNFIQFIRSVRLETRCKSVLQLPRLRQLKDPVIPLCNKDVNKTARILEFIEERLHGLKELQIRSNFHIELFYAENGPRLKQWKHIMDKRIIEGKMGIFSFKLIVASENKQIMVRKEVIKFLRECVGNVADVIDEGNEFFKLDWQ